MPGRTRDLAQLPLNGGDDYELVFTAPPIMRDQIRERAAATGTPVTRIGRVVEGNGVSPFAAGRPLPVKGQGWQHF